MTDKHDKLLFRLQHLIPQGLSSAACRVDKHESKMANFPSTNLLVANTQNNESSLQPEEAIFDMSYGRMAAKIWGPPDGRPVFALHGWLDNSGSFDRLIPLLPKNLRIVAVDFPGHGLSDHYPADIMYHFNDCLLAVERLAHHFKWTKFSFIGHSLGGCIGMLYAGIFPEKVEKLVNLDIVRVVTTRPETMNLRLKKTVNKLLKYETAIKSGPEKPFSYETAVEKSINGSFGSLDRKSCEIMLRRGLRKVDGGYVFTRDRRLHAAPLSFVPKPDQLILAQKVTADVLIIKFKDGPYFESDEDQQEHIEALKTSSKSVKYVEVDGRHHTHLTHPERISSIISNFFGS